MALHIGRGSTISKSKNHDEAEKMKVLTYKDSSLLKVAASVESTGKIPSPAQARAIMAIKERLEKEGIFV